MKRYCLALEVAILSVLVGLVAVPFYLGLDLGEGVRRGVLLLGVGVVVVSFVIRRSEGES